MTIPDSKFLMENGGASCVPCPPEEEKRVIAELTKEAESDLKEGNTYFVISNRWFTSWQKYVGDLNSEFSLDEQSSDCKYLNTVPLRVEGRPGPIDNSDIVVEGDDCKDDGMEVREMLVEGSDYVIVPPKVWQKFHEWYNGGPPLPRKMILQGLISKTFVVEVYPLRLHLIDSRDQSKLIIRLSRKASVRKLYEKVCELKGVDQEKACLWDYFGDIRHTELVDSDQTLEESHLQMDQVVLLEMRMDGHHSSQPSVDSTGNKFALVPLEPSRSSSTIAGGPSISNGYSNHGFNRYEGNTLTTTFRDIDDGYEATSSSRRKEKGGLTGLQNLGNTCFMNSAIQCLVHTPPIVEFFLQDYADQINAENPLGMHGELAIAFGDLLRKLWSSGQTAMAPRVFKGKLARFAPQFSGYNQHDSQELLAFLLDGLHEDLNRVKKKPYIETEDSDGRPDEVVAEESWKYHKARNDSIIVDICQGQYKSTLVCPVCKKISITFDPFMYLTLPLPSTETRTMTITLFHGEGSGLPMPYTVTMLKRGTCKDLYLALSTACCLQSNESLLFAEVYENRIHRYLENPLEPLSSIKDDDYIVAYQHTKDKAGKRKLEIMHRCQENERKLLGTPLVTYVGEDALSGIEIDVAVQRMLAPLRKYSSSSNIHGGPGKGLKPESTEEPMKFFIGDIDITEAGPSRSDSKIEPEGESDMDLSFHISLTDDRCSSSKLVNKKSIIESGQLVKVFLDWTDKDHELYDATSLNDLPEVHKAGFTLKKTRPEAVSLHSCLEAFLMEEPLGPDDMWYCPECKEHRQATKKLDLWRLPDILVFHLKRFSYNRYLKNKLDTFVNFPIHDLDLTKYVKSNRDGQSHVYELYAISNHYGVLGGGHYTAYAKLIDEDRWYHFDDSHVSPISEAEIRTSAAYVLFYKRVKK